MPCLQQQESGTANDSDFNPNATEFNLLKNTVTFQ